MEKFLNITVFTPNLISNSKIQAEFLRLGVKLCFCSAPQRGGLLTQTKITSLTQTGRNTTDTEATGRMQEDSMP
jgi:hypothetical protein